MAVLLFPDFCYLQNQKKKKKKSAFFFPWYLQQDSNFDATEYWMETRLLSIISKGLKRFSKV